MEGHKLARFGLVLCALTIGLGIALGGTGKVGYKCDPNVKCEKCENFYDAGGNFVYSCLPTVQTYPACADNPGKNCITDGFKSCSGMEFDVKDCGVASNKTCNNIYDKCK